MGDGAKAMCWSHVHHNIVPRLKSIATIDKFLSEKILLNIMDIQWSSLNEAIFLKMFQLLEKKHVGKHDKNLEDLIKEFFAYLDIQW